MKYLHSFKLPTGNYYIAKGPFLTDSPVGKYTCRKNGCGISTEFSTKGEAESFLVNYIIADLKRRNKELEKEVDKIGEVLDIIEEDDKSWIYKFLSEKDN